MKPLTPTQKSLLAGVVLSGLFVFLHESGRLQTFITSALTAQEEISFIRLSKEAETVLIIPGSLVKITLHGSEPGSESSAVPATFSHADQARNTIFLFPELDSDQSLYSIAIGDISAVTVYGAGHRGGEMAVKGLVSLGLAGAMLGTVLLRGGDIYNPSESLILGTMCVGPPSALVGSVVGYIAGANQQARAHYTISDEEWRIRLGQATVSN